MAITHQTPFLVVDHEVPYLQVLTSTAATQVRASPDAFCRTWHVSTCAPNSSDTVPYFVLADAINASMELPCACMQLTVIPCLHQTHT